MKTCSVFNVQNLVPAEVITVTAQVSVFSLAGYLFDAFLNETIKTEKEYFVFRPAIIFYFGFTLLQSKVYPKMMDIIGMPKKFSDGTQQKSHI